MADERTKFYIWTRIFDLLRDVVKYGAYVFLGYWAYLSIDALAGKTTLADIALSYFTSKENDHGLPWILVVIFVIWAALERRLRLRKTVALADQIKELQKRIDPQRTSSGLLQTGETNPKDKTI